MASITPLLLTLKHHGEDITGVKAVSSAQDDLSHYDVLLTGTGTAHSKVVTRYKRALTGQELSRWSRMRSLYCLI